MKASATATLPAPPATPSQRPCGQGRIEVGWARHEDEVREAQRLRFDVFAGELGARLATPVPGHDIDRFDDYCEHLLVRDALTGEVVGTYRLLTPAQALRAGGTYCDNEFDLARLAPLRARMVELGRSCVHPRYRQGGVILALWAALAAFMGRNGLETMIGCASIPVNDAGAHNLDSGRSAAAGLWHQVRRDHLADPRYHVQPRIALPVDGPLPVAAVEPPPLIKGYLRLGAKALGPPAWDAAFNTADLPMMMRMADLPERYRRSANGG